MLPKTVRLAGMLGAAVGVPYAIHESPKDWGMPWGVTQPAPAVPQDQANGAPIDPKLLAPPQSTLPEGPGSNVYRSQYPLEGPRNMPLAYALRWDVTKEWVYQQWARKSTGLADPTLYGVRVPLVTGARMTDLAGSLSYYFDAQGVLQRIHFLGRTADTTEVARIATERFGMQRRVAVSPGDQLFQVADGDRVRSELRTRPEATLWSTSPHESFLVELDVNRPGGPSWPSPRASTLDLAGSPLGAPSAAGAAAPPAKPVFPARSVVPDAAGSGGDGTLAGQGLPKSPEGSVRNLPTDASNASGGAPGGTPIGSFRAADAAGNDLKPLVNYRDRFRWPD
jgi:hypothetical protein